MMSNYHDYGAAQGPEVNVRMKVDIYTEGPNEGVIFDQVVYTGAPEGFDAQAWSNNLPKAAIAHPPANRMLEYPKDQAADETNNNDSGKESRRRSSRRHREDRLAAASQSSLASATASAAASEMDHRPALGAEPESGAEAPARHHRKHRGGDGDKSSRKHRRHRGEEGEERKSSRRHGARSEASSAVPHTSSEGDLHTSREAEEQARQSSRSPQRPTTLLPNGCHLDHGPPEIPESYSRQGTPSGLGYSVETPGETSQEPEPSLRINTFEEPAFTPSALSGMLSGLGLGAAAPQGRQEPPQIATLDDVNASIAQLVRLMDERLTVTTTEKVTAEKTQLSPALSTGSKKFQRVSFEEPAKVNPNSRETLIDDAAPAHLLPQGQPHCAEAGSREGGPDQPALAAGRGGPSQPHYAEASSPSRAEGGGRERSSRGRRRPSPDYAEVQHVQQRVRSVSAERYARDPYTPQPYISMDLPSELYIPSPYSQPPSPVPPILDRSTSPPPRDEPHFGPSPTPPVPAPRRHSASESSLRSSLRLNDSQDSAHIRPDQSAQFRSDQSAQFRPQEAARGPKQPSQAWLQAQAASGQHRRQGSLPAPSGEPTGQLRADQSAQFIQPGSAQFRGPAQTGQAQLSRSGSHSELSESLNVALADKLARLGTASGAQVDIAPLETTRPQTLDIAPVVRPPVQHSFTRSLPAPEHIAHMAPSVHLSPVLSTSHQAGTSLPPGGFASHQAATSVPPGGSGTVSPVKTTATGQEMRTGSPVKTATASLSPGARSRALYQPASHSQSAREPSPSGRSHYQPPGHGQGPPSPRVAQAASRQAASGVAQASSDQAAQPRKPSSLPLQAPKQPSQAPPLSSLRATAESPVFYSANPSPSPQTPTRFSGTATPSPQTPTRQRVNPQSTETLIDDVVEEASPPPLPPPQRDAHSSSSSFAQRGRELDASRSRDLAPSPLSSVPPPRAVSSPEDRSGRSKSPSALSAGSGRTKSPSVLVNPHYAASQQEEDSFDSSVSSHRPAYRPPLGDWTREVDEERQRSSTASTEHSGGIPLFPERLHLPPNQSSDSSNSTLENAMPMPPPSKEALDKSNESFNGEHAGALPRLNVPSSRIFEVYTRQRGSGSGASGSDASTPSPLPPPLPPKASGSELPPPPPPPAIVSAPMAELDESLESAGTLRKDEAHRHSIYTISEAGTELEEEAAREHHAQQRREESARMDRHMRQAISGGWTGTARSRSSIDSERSSVSGALRGGGAYNVRDGSLLGEGDNLSDYLQSRLSPVGRDWDGEASMRSSDSVISEASLRADQQLALYGTLDSRQGSSKRPPQAHSQAPTEERHSWSSSRVSTTTEVTVDTRSSLHEADSLRWKKMVLDHHRSSGDYLHRTGPAEEQLRKDFFGQAGSTASVSSVGSVKQDSVKVAPVLQRPPMQSGGMYGEARIGMASVGAQHSGPIGQSHPMTQRLSPHLPRDKPKPARPTAL